MSDAVIRQVTPDDDMEAQVDLGQRAFGIYSPAQRVAWLQVALLRARQGAFLGAFVDGEPAGAAIFHDMRQYWLGSAVPMAGVASVKVAPEHRGKGIGRRLMAEVLAAVAGRGYPLSVLVPATMPIYRSLGWELAGASYQAAIPGRSLRTLLAPDAVAAARTDRTAAAHAGGAAHGGVAIRRASADDAAKVIAVTARAHQLARDAGPLTWDAGPLEGWLAHEELFCYLAGDDGFAAYRWSDGNDNLFVERVHASTPEALRALWSVIASHSSTARVVTARIAPADPFWWLTHERDARLVKRSMWMLRVVDAPAAIAARGFPSAVCVSAPLEIRDQARPANSGHWQLTVADGKGTLIPNGPVSSPAPRDWAGPAGAPQTPAGSPPAAVPPPGAGAAGAAAPLTVGARGLAALYAGTPVATLRLAGLAAGGAPGADAALDAAFAATPYMVDDF